MPFAPVMNNIGPALIEAGYGNSAKFNMQGAEAMAAGIESAGKSVGGGIAAAAGKWSEESAKRDFAKGGVEAIYAQVKANPKNADLYGGNEFINKMMNEKNATKQSAMVGAAMSWYDQNVAQRNRMALQDDQQAFAAGQVTQRAAAGAAVKPMFGVDMPPGVNIYGGGNNASGR